MVRRVENGGQEQRLQVINLTQGAEIGASVEVARYGAKRRKGLLGCPALPPGEGLWIVPCEAVHTFGMQFELDLIFLDREKRVKKVRSNVGPWRMSGCLTAHSVLELPAGTISDTRTRPGDRLEFSPSARRIERP